MSDQKLEFGELQVGDHFIGFPLPGDNSGHGGYLKGHRLFVKTDREHARDGRGEESHMPVGMFVVKVLLG